MSDNTVPQRIPQRQPILNRDSILAQFRDASALAWRPGRANLAYVGPRECVEELKLRDERDD